MTRDSVLPLDELVRIRRGRNRNESSRDLPDFLCEHARGVSLHDDGSSPFRSVDLEESRDVTKEATMVASDVWIEGAVEPRQLIRPESFADRGWTVSNGAYPPPVNGQSNGSPLAAFDVNLASRPRISSRRGDVPKRSRVRRKNVRDVVVSRRPIQRPP